MYRQIKSGLTQVTSGVNRWFDKVLLGTDYHFRCFFPRRFGKPSSYLLRVLFSGIRIGDSQMEVIRKLPEDALIVYTNKYKSDFEFLFYHTRYDQEGLPVPEIGFDYKVFFLQPLSRLFRIFMGHVHHFFTRFSFPDPYDSGYIRDELKNGHAAMLSLVEKRGFYLRFVKSNPDPLRYLIETQHSTARPIYIVPQLIFYSKRPYRSRPGLLDMLFGSQENPGKIRRVFAFFRKPASVFVEVSEPVNLKAYIEREGNRDLSPGKQALKLRRLLLVQINRHRQSITGPILKSKEELKENILTNDRLRSFLEHFAETRDTPLYKVYKEANTNIDEIAARYSANLIQVMSVVLRWMINLMFEGVSINTAVLNRVKGMSRRGPLVLVPCHKSHIDYLILSYILYHNDMPCPHIAAGKNLSFWPMGPIFRAGGAFFIRRTFKGAVLYSKVFAEYVFKLLEEGFNVEFFIEGGRSRTGKLLAPKLGLLNILLNAFRMGASEDLIFVPVFVGYDRVLEEGAYLHELEGGQKRPENLWQILKARKFLKKRYGIIYIRFHEGISMNDLLAREGKTFQEMSTKEQNTFCRNLGYRLVNAIDKVTVVTPHAVVAAAVLNAQKHRFSHRQLMEDIQTCMNYLTIHKVTLADTLLVEPDLAFQYVIDSYIQRKFIEPVSLDKAEKTDRKEGEAEEREYIVNESKRPALDYYKNNSVSAFIPGAFTALAILERDAFQFSTHQIHDSYAFLLRIMKNEFAYDVEKTPEHFIQKNIKSFIDEAVLIPHPTLPDTYNLTSAGYRKLKIFSAFLKTYFESYWIALNFFMRYPRNFIESKDRLKKIQSMGNRMYKKKEVELPESLSKINLKNAMGFFLSEGVKGSEDEELIQFFAEKIRRYLNLLQS